MLVLWMKRWMWWSQIGVLARSQLVKSASWRTHKASFSSLIAEGVEGGSSQLIRIVGLRQDKEQPGKPPGPNLPLLNHPSSSALLPSVLPSLDSQTGAPPPPPESKRFNHSLPKGQQIWELSAFAKRTTWKKVQQGVIMLTPSCDQTNPICRQTVKLLNWCC